MQSSSNKIILILYKSHVIQLSAQKFKLSSIIPVLTPYQTIIRICISSIKSEYVIIEVILKDHSFSIERYNTV